MISLYPVYWRGRGLLVQGCSCLTHLPPLLYTSQSQSLYHHSHVFPMAPICSWRSKAPLPRSFELLSAWAKENRLTELSKHLFKKRLLVFETFSSLLVVSWPDVIYVIWGLVRDTRQAGHSSQPHPDLV